MKGTYLGVKSFPCFVWDPSLAVGAWGSGNWRSDPASMPAWGNRENSQERATDQRENPKAGDSLGLLVRVTGVLGSPSSTFPPSLPPDATNPVSQWNVRLLQLLSSETAETAKKWEAEGSVLGAQGGLQLPLDGCNVEMTAKCKCASCSIRRNLA